MFHGQCQGIFSGHQYNQFVSAHFQISLEEDWYYLLYSLERLILRSFFPFATVANCTVFFVPQWPISNVYNSGKDHTYEGKFPGFMQHLVAQNLNSIFAEMKPKFPAG